MLHCSAMLTKGKRGLLLMSPDIMQNKQTWAGTGHVL